MENNYREWNVSIYAVFICPEEKIDITTMKSLANEWADGNNLDVMTDFLSTLANLSYYNLGSMKRFTGKIKIPSNKYLDLAKKMKFNFKYKLKGGTNTGGFSETIIPIITEFGLCYAHNSQIAMMQNDNRTTENKGMTTLLASFLKPGESRMVSDMNTGYHAYFTSPWEVPGVGALQSEVMVPYTYITDIDMLVSATYATGEVLKLDIGRRKCRFYNESNLVISPSVYSVNLCRSQCRIDLAMKLCKCAPFFYDGLLEAGYKICDVDGMICLAEKSDLLIFINSKKTMEILSCNCDPTCERETYVFTDEPVTAEWPMNLGHTTLRWVMKTFPTIRMKRDVMFTFPDVLVAFGGTAGLFLGCSVLSMVEIFYYVTLRLLFYIKSDRNQPNSIKKSTYTS